MKSALKSLLLATTTATLMTSTAAVAYEAGDFLIKGGAAHVATHDSSSDITPLGGSQGADVGDNTQLGLTFTYMYSDHWGIELLAATPFEHDVDAFGATIGKGGPVANGAQVGTVKHLPPTLTLNYYPAAKDSKIQPYVGAGINYTVFFDEDASSQFESIAGPTDISLTDSWGLAFHAGVDYQLNDNWSLNAGYWYIDIDTDVTLRTSLPGALASLKLDIDIDPSVYMLGLSYKF
jgi:outer membrane protein